MQKARILFCPARQTTQACFPPAKEDNDAGRKVGRFMSSVFYWILVSISIGAPAFFCRIIPPFKAQKKAVPTALKTKAPSTTSNGWMRAPFRQQPAARSSPILLSPNLHELAQQPKAIQLMASVRCIHMKSGGYGHAIPLYYKDASIIYQPSRYFKTTIPFFLRVLAEFCPRIRFLWDLSDISC